MIARRRALKNSASRKFHIDKRAAQVAAAAPKQEMLTTAELANWLGVSTQFLEIGRCKGYGPAFVPLSPKVLRYRKVDVIAWLEQRTKRFEA